MRAPLRLLVFLAALAAGAAPAGAFQAPPLSQQAQDMADRARTKVIVLKTHRGTTLVSATGFLARPGIVLTAAHTVDNVSSIVAWINGVGYRADKLAVHPEYDLALLRLRAPDLLLKPVELAATAATLGEGEPLVILAGPSQGPGAKGDPTNRNPIPAAYRSRVVLRASDGRAGPLLAMSAAVQRGDSGSPVLRVKDGTVVGVLSSREVPDDSGISNRAYAVPIELVNAWLDTMPKQEEEKFYLFELAGR
jgi:S1-C subfamily serine protease